MLKRDKIKLNIFLVLITANHNHNALRTIKIQTQAIKQCEKLTQCLGEVGGVNTQSAQSITDQKGFRALAAIQTHS